MNKIKELCNKIEASAQGIYTKGCDGVAQNNMARLMEICGFVAEIRAKLEQEGEHGD